MARANRVSYEQNKSLEGGGEEVIMDCKLNKAKTLTKIVKSK